MQLNPPVVLKQSEWRHSLLPLSMHRQHAQSIVMGCTATVTPSVHTYLQLHPSFLSLLRAQPPPLCLPRRWSSGADDKSGPKVVNEVYDELVFWEPTEALYNRVKQLGAERGRVIDAPDPVAPQYSEQAELSSLLAIRHRVAEDKSRILSKSGRG